MLATVKKDGFRWAMTIRKNRAVIREDYHNMRQKVMAIHTRAEGNKVCIYILHTQTYIHMQ